MKGGEVITQGGSGSPESQLEPADLDNPSLDAAHGLDHVRIPYDRDLWTSLEAAAYLRFQTLNAFYSWVHIKGVPRERRGKEALYRKADLDKVLRQDARRVVGKREFFSTAHTGKS